MSDSTPIGQERLEIYRQMNARFLNTVDTMHRIPVAFSTILGALWYFAFSDLDRLPWVSLFVFSAAVSYSGWNQLRRIGDYLPCYLPYYLHA